MIILVYFVAIILVIVFGILGLVKLITALVNKSSKKLAFIFLGICAACIIGMALPIIISSNDNKGIVTILSGDYSGREMSIKEVCDLLEDNEIQYDNNIKNQQISVIGKVTDISSGYISSNLNHSFENTITIADTIVVEVADDHPALDSVSVGDTITVVGNVSTDLYGKIYMYGYNAIMLGEEN